ncbi:MULTISPECIES: NarK/NasA family nitrate transporter [Lactobacillus]|uniref:NarK/NasA family nitrate transporter n=1 Tax=Lactobacillus xujianguonis TaxID=2495899 RepID=A0A437SVM7_9LACO|nr:MULTISPECIES: NarK/NasA family nitrate transporter [Lactobacillus]RVU70979.1 NarK/NasA family nitrate transporter [Lactobacillus xujianguonis]RVU73402.1 NarK/NasA family nitrate transporter [Lactobacillus xujianguonis]
MTEQTQGYGSRKDAYLALTLSTVAMIACFMSWSNFAPLATQVGQMFHLSVANRTLLLATPVLLGSIMRIPVGILSDKYGGKKVYLILMAFILIPLFMIPHVHSFGMLLFAALLVGMAGTSFAVGVSYASVWFPKKQQGLALGIVSMGNMGNAVAAMTLPYISKSYGFDAVYYFLIGLTVVLGILFAIFCKEMPVDKTKTLKGALSVTKESSTWYLSLFYFLTFGLFVAFTNLTPMFLTGLFGYSQVTAGLYSALFAGLCTLIRPIGGYWADKKRPMTLLLWTFSAIIVFAIVIMLSFKNEALFIAGIVLVGLAAGIGNGVIFKMVPFVSSGNTGAVTGFVGAMGGLGGFFPPLVIGWIKEWTGSYELGIALLVLTAIICLFALWKHFIHDAVHIVK